MITVFIRTIIIYLFLVIGMRLMGKRTIGELQPFEFTITLAIADLACMPMQDISVPIVYGLVPLFVMFLLHYFITILTSKSIKFRRFINGKPVIVINENGLDYEALKSLNVDVNDVLESLRSQQFFSPEQVKFAVYETNGNVSILERTEAREPTGIPVTVVVEGRLMETNVRYTKYDKESIESFIKNKGYKAKEILLMTIDGSHVFLQPNHAPYLVGEMEEEHD